LLDTKYILIFFWEKKPQSEICASFVIGINKIKAKFGIFKQY